VRILLTGGAGFIGHHVVKHILDRYPEVDLTLIDRLDDSGNLNRLNEVGANRNPRVKFIYHNLRAPINEQLARQIGHHDFILHLAAATHVDRSLADPMEFVLDNVVATCNILDFARKHMPRLFVQFSTDEVFGPAPEGVRYKENDRFACSNAYSATKAGAEELAMSYFKMYKLPVIVTHTMNVCGIRQHPEKMIPGTISKILKGEKVIIHANRDEGKAGTRFYIDAADVADAVMFLLGKGVAGEKYNVVGKEEVDNLTLAGWIAAGVAQPWAYELIDGARPGNRPGHDLRYALDGSKMADMGWEPRIDIAQSVADITHWSLENRQWLNV
jgi:dTDP-glucose 4,6-dehydratase